MVRTGTTAGVEWLTRLFAQAMEAEVGSIEAEESREKSDADAEHDAEVS